MVCLAAAVAIVVMGVSGSGKSTAASAIAGALRRAYLDADDLHPAENIDKLRAGVALTDADRASWLDAVAGWIDTNPPSVVACSALRRAYRDRLRAARTPVWFLHLDPPVEVLATRLSRRRGHFMPASQLPDQIATLEPLEPGEPGLRVVGAAEVDDLLARTAAARTPDAGW